MITKRDWTLLAIAAAKGESLSPVQLQKALFLLGKMKLNEDADFYSFEPYNYGPYDATIYRDAESLASDKFVSIQMGGRWKSYAVTPTGLRVAERIKRSADPNAVDYLERVVEWARTLSFQELVRAVYARFPEYRVNSVFQG